MSLGILLGLLVVLLLLRVPVAFSLLIPSLVYIFLDPTANFGTAIQRSVAGVNTFPLLAVPLFMMLGNVANVSGITDKIYDAATSIVGHVRGSLGYVNVITSFLFAWMSGAAIADAAASGRVQVPAMIRRGYPQEFSVGITAGSALVSPILPPSIPAVIYAVTAGVSVGGLFLAGIGPALLLVAVLSVAVWFSMRKRDDLRLPKSPIRTQVKLSLKALPGLGTAVIVLGGILGGVFTPTEAAGIAVLYMLALTVIYRRATKASLARIFRDTTVTAGSILLIVTAASLFGWILARERVPQLAAEFFLSVSDNPLVFLLLLNVLLLVIGSVLEPVAAILIVVPVIAPVALEFGLEPLHVGMVVIFNLLLGLVTPPVGLVLFVLSGVTDIPAKDVIRGVLPIYLPLLITLLVLTLFPAISTFLPSLFGLG
jgi:tripartite ATP-independent transporter DctM subunit